MSRKINTSQNVSQCPLAQEKKSISLTLSRHYTERFVSIKIILREKGLDNLK